MISDATLSKSVHADTLGAWVLMRDERTVYDEWNPVAQIDAAGQVVQRHLWGTDLSGTPQGADGVGGLLGTWDNGATTRDGSEPGDGVARVWVCAYDGNGNVSAAIAATVAGSGASGNGGGGAGTVRVARYDYDAFGKTLATWGDGAVAEANRYRFSTKPEDGTGLLYYGYRYLDTRLGRWVSRDPIGEDGGINLYTYIGNFPYDEADYLGLSFEWKRAIVSVSKIVISLTMQFGGENGTFKPTLRNPVSQRHEQEDKRRKQQIEKSNRPGSAGTGGKGRWPAGIFPVGRLWAPVIGGAIPFIPTAASAAELPPTVDLSGSQIDENPFGEHIVCIYEVTEIKERAIFREIDGVISNGTESDKVIWEAKLELEKGCFSCPAFEDAVIELGFKIPIHKN